MHPSQNRGRGYALLIPADLNGQKVVQWYEDYIADENGTWAYTDEVLYDRGTGA